MDRKEFVEKFKVGDKIALADGLPKVYLIIDYIGKDNIVGTSATGSEAVRYIDNNWIPYEEPKSEPKKIYYEWLAWSDYYSRIQVLDGARTEEQAKETLGEYKWYKKTGRAWDKDGNKL